MKVRRVPPWELLLRNPFSTSTVMMRAGQPYAFDETRRRAEDYDLWCRMILSGASAIFLRFPLAYMFKRAYGASGLSKDLALMSAAEARVLEDLSRDDMLPKWAYAPTRSWARAKHVRRSLITYMSDLRDRQRSPR